MEERMNDAFRKFCSKLTDEQKGRAKKCQTWDELMEFAGNEGVELPDEFLDFISGGKKINFRPVELETIGTVTSQSQSRTNT